MSLAVVMRARPCGSHDGRIIRAEAEGKRDTLSGCLAASAHRTDDSRASVQCAIQPLSASLADKQGSMPLGRSPGSSN